jgi:hypothetical protein
MMDSCEGDSASSLVLEGPLPPNVCHSAGGETQRQVGMTLAYTPACLMSQPWVITSEIKLCVGKDGEKGNKSSVVSEQVYVT